MSAPRRRLPWTFWGAPLGALATYLLLARGGLEAPACGAAATAVWMAGWWVSEALPLEATSLLPVLLFPLLGVASVKASAAPFAHPVIFLFMGGFMMANTMERWGLHRRLALLAVRAVGTSPRRLVAGFMVAVAGLSMWVSNTATAVMMLPTGLSVADLVAERVAAEQGPDAEARRRDAARFGTALVLGIAYAASIGGVGTLIGTPPNAQLSAFVETEYGQLLAFGDWMLLGLPVVLGLLPLAWWVLVRGVFPFQLTEVPGGAELIERELEALGPTTAPERRVLVVFAAAAVLWVLRPLLLPWLPGLSDAGIAVAGAMTMFCLPAGDGEGGRLLDWETARRIPWGVLLLFGGGLSLAAALSATGVADALGRQLAWLGQGPPWLLVVGITATVTVLTEFTSNTATVATLLPVLAALAKGIGVHPYRLLPPAAIAASCAFMFPAATASNALALGTGRVTLRQMIRAGFWLNLAAIAWISLLALVWSGRALGVDLGRPGFG